LVIIEEIMDVGPHQQGVDGPVSVFMGGNEFQCFFILDIFTGLADYEYRRMIQCCSNTPHRRVRGGKYAPREGL
jgi:hypothetical protein